MSKTQIPEWIKILLWTNAGGRCEYDRCNKPLWFDFLTKRKSNSAYIAHIVADVPTGPRGDAVLSPQLSKDLSNLMLMCDTHHRMIDNRDNLSIFTVEALIEMKKKHEDRIELLTSIEPDKMSHMLFYTPNTGKNSIPISTQNAMDAMLPEWFPAEKNPIELTCVGSDYKDHEEKYWDYERDQLNRKFEANVKCRIQSGDIRHLSVFAIGPQPLLIELGRLISDIQPAIIYQKHREPDTWKWQNEPYNIDYVIKEPEQVYKTVALNLSLSATITNDRITDLLGEEVSIWTMSIDNRNNDSVRSHSHVALFRKKMRLLFDRIKEVHGQNVRLHVFPACPVSISVELGRVWMPKADLCLVLFDQNNAKQHFIHTFDIE
jgi:hypothetical protein